MPYISNGFCNMLYNYPGLLGALDTGSEEIIHEGRIYKLAGQDKT